MNYSKSTNYSEHGYVKVDKQHGISNISDADDGAFRGSVVCFLKHSDRFDSIRNEIFSIQALNTFSKCKHM